MSLTKKGKKKFAESLAVSNGPVLPRNGREGMKLLIERFIHGAVPHNGKVEEIKS